MTTDTRTIGETYLDLILAYPLRPLRSEADLDCAVAMPSELEEREVLRLHRESWLAHNPESSNDQSE